MNKNHYDILIIGAGLSGIGTARKLLKDHPNKSLAILERRNRIGGTWDLFRYPGIRSDSDMLSYGYEDRLWEGEKVLADGDEIRDYIEQTAEEAGLKKHIQYGLRITHANWSSDRRCWELIAINEETDTAYKYSCSFLICCTGYYNHDEGFLPNFPGESSFRGLRIHPQHWPEDLDYSGKRVVVIGSGATAVTLIPSMADKTQHITMLQRSPSYIYSIPQNDLITKALMKVIPANWARRLARKRNTVMYRMGYLACRAWPKTMRRVLLAHVKSQVGPAVDMRHFTPSYMPWDERVAAVPGGDMFKAIREGKASVETGQIDRFTEHGVLLKSGKELPADIIITATGLRLQLFGDMKVSINNVPCSVADQMMYKSLLVEGMPNLAWIIGYTNVSWTLKVGMASTYLSRLFSHMEAIGADVVTPRDDDNNTVNDSILNSMTSGYIQRDQHHLPRQGKGYPWTVFMHLGKDKRMLLQEPIADRYLQFQPRNTAAHTTNRPASVSIHPASYRNSNGDPAQAAATETNGTMEK